jgi:hypothetical protein
MRIYVASSWRNVAQPRIVSALIEAGHEVYDFRNPSENDTGFRWSDIDQDWQKWTPEQYRTALTHRIAEHGFKNDFDAMMWADTGVLVLPCGRSAHDEIGWMVGAGKKTYILMLNQEEPELMYKLHDGICPSVEELLAKIS